MRLRDLPAERAIKSRVKSRQSRVSPARPLARAMVIAILLGLGVAAGPLAAQETDPPIAAEPVAAPVAAAATSALGPPLVSLATVVTTTDKVQVAGLVDHASLVTDKLAGESRFSFTLQGPNGASVKVVAAGRPPFGFERTSAVVVEGRWRDGAVRASSVLIPGTNRGLFGVMAITMIVWLGLFAYVFWVERRLTGLQRSMSNHDQSS